MFNIFLIIALVFLIYFFISYNSLITKKNLVAQAFSTIDILLKKRSDLIPNLVTVAKQYMEFESQILTEISRLRSIAISDKVATKERIVYENKIQIFLDRIFFTIEAYPELKANDYFLHLQMSLSELEEQISAARRFYNSAVTDYNNALEVFPTNLIAFLMDYQAKQLFIANNKERANVNIKNLFNR